METTLGIMAQVPEWVRCDGWKHLLSTGPGPQVICFLDVTYERFFGWSPGRSSLTFKQLVVEGMGMSSGSPNPSLTLSGAWKLGRWCGCGTRASE